MSQEINNDTINNIIAKSGHDFHIKISKLLEKKGWKVSNSPHYNDPATNVPREIDIIAENNFEVGDFFYNKKSNLTIRLFIECKYIKNPFVFWFLEKNLKKAKELAKSNQILNGKEDIYLNSEDKIHHYIKDLEVAKEFSSIDEQQLYKAINQILNATLFFSKNQDTNRYTVNFPIIVINSFDNFKKRNDSQNGYEQIDKNFEIEVDYTFLSNPEYFLIDVISEDKIDNFLDYINNHDIKILQNTLSWDIRLREAKKNYNPGRNSCG